jgi:succinate-acetate transporter protein
MTDSIDTKSPVPAAWILGLFGLAGATFVMAAHMAGWYGGPESARFIFPFAAVLGGAVPLLAAMWAYEARDALATAMLGVWGAFWAGYGLLHLLVVAGKFSVPVGAFPELSFWFIALAAITWVGAGAAMAESAALTSTLTILAIASTIAAIAEGLGIHRLMLLTGWLFLLGAVCEWYTATAMMFEEMFGREVLPLGRYSFSVAPPRSIAAQPRSPQQPTTSQRAS